MLIEYSCESVQCSDKSRAERERDISFKSQMLREKQRSRSREIERERDGIHASANPEARIDAKPSWT